MYQPCCGNFKTRLLRAFKGRKIMESRYLESFVRVAELGSIAEAARALDLAPATVAQRLKALEIDMECQLLQRTGRTVRPTLAGNRILQHARAILATELDMRSAATNNDLPPGPLRLGATPTALTAILPAVLKEWRRQHPDITVLIDAAGTPLLHARLQNGELDVAIMAHPHYALPKTCGWRPLGKEPLVMIAPHVLAVTDVLRTLETEDFILYDRRAVAGKMVDDYLKKIHIRPNVSLELDGIVPIAEPVGAGLGVAVVPESPALRLHEGTLRVWPLPSPRPYRTLGALWLRSSPRLRLAEVFLDIIIRMNAARNHSIG